MAGHTGLKEFFCDRFAKDHVLFSFLAALLGLFWITLSKNFICQVAQGKKNT